MPGFYSLTIKNLNMAYPRVKEFVDFMKGRTERFSVLCMQFDPEMNIRKDDIEYIVGRIAFCSVCKTWEEKSLMREQPGQGDICLKHSVNN